MNDNYYRSVNRRTIAMILVLGLVISSCGFKPRGSGFESLSGQSVVLASKNPFGPLERSLMEKFRSYSISAESIYLSKEKPDVQHFEPNDEQNGIQVSFVNYSRKTLSVDANGRPAEYDSVINVDVIFLLSDGQKQLKHFIVQRDYRFDTTNSLAHDRELEILTSEMIDDLGQRIVSQFLSQLATQSL